MKGNNGRHACPACDKTIAGLLLAAHMDVVCARCRIDICPQVADALMRESSVGDRIRIMDYERSALASGVHLRLFVGNELLRVRRR